MRIQQLEYLSALARQQHFGRAAEECHVSPASLSAGIRALEQELGHALVERGHAFERLTPMGEQVLLRGRRILADVRGLREDLDAMEGHLTGVLRLGVIPTALSSVGALTANITSRSPEVSVHVTSMMSREIHRGMSEFRLDAGVTYLDEDVPPRSECRPLYVETYSLVVGPGAPSLPETVTWAQAAELPLCLLTPGMRSRQIVDELFARVGATPEPRFETDSMTALYAHVRASGHYAVIPHGLPGSEALQDHGPGLRRIRLVEPDARREVGLVTPALDRCSPLATALHIAVDDLTSGAGRPTLSFDGG